MYENHGLPEDETTVRPRSLVKFSYCTKVRNISESNAHVFWCGKCFFQSLFNMALFYDQFALDFIGSISLEKNQYLQTMNEVTDREREAAKKFFFLVARPQRGG